MISKWKQEFLTRGSEIFSTKAHVEEAAMREKMLYENEHFKSSCWSMPVSPGSLGCLRPGSGCPYSVPGEQRGGAGTPLGELVNIFMLETVNQFTISPVWSLILGV